jgi:hypothetical protein
MLGRCTGGFQYLWVGIGFQRARLQLGTMPLQRTGRCADFCTDNGWAMDPTTDNRSLRWAGFYCRYHSLVPVSAVSSSSHGQLIYASVTYNVIALHCRSFQNSSARHTVLWDFAGWTGDNADAYVSFPCGTTPWQGLKCTVGSLATCTVQAIALPVSGPYWHRYPPVMLWFRYHSVFTLLAFLSCVCVFW